MLRRRTIRRQFIEFAKACGFEPAPHHALLSDKLQSLAEGRSRFLMVFMPPGSAKSTYSSILFPAWYLAQEYAGNVIAASHSSELAERFGRKVRALVAERGPTLGYALAADSQAAGRWGTTLGREYYAAGVGVGIAGFRSKLNIVDDPFRNRQDAESKLIRDKVWDWFNDDLDTRLIPGGGTALIMTRWHDDDLAGRILARAKVTGEPIDVVSIPAIAGENDALGRKPGEWLWEGEYGYAERLREKHRTTDPRSWASLYQQNPTPDTGDFFKADWIVPVSSIPPLANMRVYGGSDYAVTADGGDYTVHAVVGVDPDENIYLLDLWRKQAASDEWVESWCDLVLKWKPMEWAEETGQIKSGVGPFLDRRANERRAYCVRTQFPTRGDKAVRAQSIRGRMAMKGLRVPADAPWRSDFVSELLRFPAGVNDDQVDALGLVGQLLDKMLAGAAPAKPQPKADPSGYSESSDHDNDFSIGML